MRVLLASLHPRDFSGQIHSLRALAQTLTAAGDQVQIRTVFASDSEGPSPLPSLVRYGASLLNLARVVARDSAHADVVHLYLPTPGFTVFADLLAALIRVPLVVGYEAPLISDDLIGSVAREARREPGFFLPRLLANNRLVAGAARYRAAAYVVSSRFQRDQLRQLGLRGRVAVIPNVVSVESGIDDGPTAARGRVGLPEAAPLIGYVGHLHPVKGVETLVRAFALVKAQKPDARLVLAWSGFGDRRPIDALLAQLGCADDVIWLGRTSLPDLLRALDVLALPYRLPIGQNAFPNTLLEAQCVRVPLVSTRVPIIAEACQDGETALLVPPDEPTLLAASLTRLLDDAPLREAMVSRQRRRYAESFAPGALAARYQDFYRSALEPAKEELALPVGTHEAVKAR